MPSEEKKKSWGLYWVVVALVLGLVLYVLSLGPVLVACDHLGWDEPLLSRTVYAPLGWLHDHTPLEKPLEWYVRAWGVK